MTEKAIKLESIFNDNRKYFISKIYDGIDYPALNREHGKMHLYLIKNMFDSFKIELEKHHPLNYYEIPNQIYKEVSYPFDKLEQFFKGSKVINKKTAYIFIYFISHKIEDLKLIAKEIDENTGN